MTHIARVRAAEQQLDAVAHLLRGLVRERDREDLAVAGLARCARRYAMRCVSTRVLPEPAPARMSRGPPGWATAACCSGFKPSSNCCTRASVAVSLTT